MTDPSWGFFDPDAITELPFGLDGKVFRSPMPFGPGDEDGFLFEQFKQTGIQAVVLLLPRAEYLQKAGRDLAELYKQAGILVYELPIQDLGAPELDRLENILKETAILARSGKSVLVHCYAGFGRTGTFLACLAIHELKLTPRQAIRWVRKYIPPAVETEEQEQFVLEYGAWYASN